jgi:hypothetical protein
MHLPVNAMIPVEIAGIILPFAGLFTKPVWNHVQILLVGAILTTTSRYYGTTSPQREKTVQLGTSVA